MYVYMCACIFVCVCAFAYKKMYFFFHLTFISSMINNLQDFPL